jgi:hypothetical protein
VLLFLFLLPHLPTAPAVTPSSNMLTSLMRVVRPMLRVARSSPSSTTSVVRVLSQRMAAFSTSTPTNGFPVTYETLNERLRHAQYAVRGGILLEAQHIDNELQVCSQVLISDQAASLSSCRCRCKLGLTHVPMNN